MDAGPRWIKYGNSYTLEVLLDAKRNEPTEAMDAKREVLVQAVAGRFSRTVVVEEFANRVTFSIPLGSIGRLSHALSWLAENRQICNIAYFSFYQMSLDQVFGRVILIHNWRLLGRNSGAGLFPSDAFKSDQRSQPNESAA